MLKYLIQTCNASKQDTPKQWHFLLFYTYNMVTRGTWSSIVVKALCYKAEGHGLETQWGEWLLLIYINLLATLHPGVFSAFDRNEY
jgi:hypothetical protein